MRFMKNSASANSRTHYTSSYDNLEPVKDHDFMYYADVSSSVNLSNTHAKDYIRWEHPFCGYKCLGKNRHCGKKWFAESLPSLQGWPYDPCTKHFNIFNNFTGPNRNPQPTTVQ